VSLAVVTHNRPRVIGVGVSQLCESRNRAHIRWLR
jgi:hypothetical protein